MFRSSALIICTGLCLFVPTLRSLAQASDPLIGVVTSLEERLDGRVGLAIYDSEDERTWEYRPDERFPMASTFKTLACAALLSRGEVAATQIVVIADSDLLAYSPITETLVGEPVELLQLCDATMRTSDNTAANKVLEVLGGPEAVTAFLREIGDETTRLDRLEPDLNEARPGDPRDTTTPRAMATTLRSLLLGNALGNAAREQLTSWMLSNEVGGPLLRAGVPADWRVADRTGAGNHGTRGIIAVMWPPDRKPLIAAIYLTETEASLEERNAAIAEIGAALASSMQKASD